MRKLLISSLFVFILLAGCSNDEAYNNAVHKGLDYIASEEYQKAESAFELAIDEKSNDKKATALLDQTVYHQEAIKAMEEGNLDIATEKAEKVINTEDGSSALVKKSKDIVASIEDLETTLAELTEGYEAALKQFENKEYKEANKTVDNILKHESEQLIFEPIKKDVKKLQEDIKSALDSEKKVAEEEKVEQEEIAKEKTATEERPAKYDLELNPNQEGFYNGVRYSGESGTAGPDETHTVEDARAMGYEVVVITRPANSDLPLIEGLDKPYDFNRFMEYSIVTHVEGRTFEMDGEYLEFLYTAINEHQDSFIAFFQDESGFVFDMSY
ncbi:hypothetical protein BBH88_03340 [Planococcus antarcticus DSM 14505]|uniref:DUF4398 domain-containing protein n=1 Tax=Planococcus antarcticus DSM 14505 TaxID=1185653 RepID=A0ABN4RBI1_9BACL|nr:hypothetical protein [Planococcus antarcticus]ANU09410.1 hypothetical protein BBH88_03340 [Planococcus antarcticus DSM 14505]